MTIWRGDYSTLPVERSTEPIATTKRAYLNLVNLKGRPFLGIGAGAYYRADDVACCARRNGHPQDEPVPCWSCTCGFYALKDGAKGPLTSSEVLLDVELLGRVLEAEDGWRAEKQRVLAVHLFRYCHVCGNLAAGVTGYRPNTSLCEPCGETFEEKIFTPGEVRRIVQTEVVWTPENPDYNEWRRVLPVALRPGDFVRVPVGMLPGRPGPAGRPGTYIENWVTGHIQVITVTHEVDYIVEPLGGRRATSTGVTNYELAIQTPTALAQVTLPGNRHVTRAINKQQPPQPPPFP